MPDEWRWIPPALWMVARRTRLPYARLNRMNRRIEILWWGALAGILSAPGCTAPDRNAGHRHEVCPEGVTTAAVIDAAHNVLADMHFTIEKLDAEHGVIKTRPLRAGQFFEFWQRENVGGYNIAESNVQSIRRTVELRVTKDAKDTSSLQPPASGLHIECNVLVQRLTLPPNEVAGVSQAYLMHTRSEAGLQVFEVTEQQREQMAWLDLGSDPALADKIVQRIERKLGR